MNQFLQIMLLLGLSSLLLLSNAYGNQKEPTDSASDLKIGKEVYMQVCAACHESGVAGAPKFGDKKAWAPHIAMGIEHMTHSVIHGIGAMPPRAGQAGLSDEKIRAAVIYMVTASR